MRAHVHTGLGEVVGQRVVVAAGDRELSVERFVGIPYALAPVGARRFAAPVPVAPWTSPLDVGGPGRCAPQLLDGPEVLPGLTPPGPIDEDCLRLDVWVPSPRREGALPVLVWIHGGSFVGGSPSVPLYDGGRLAAEGDVVVVSIGYRVGALGFCDLRRWVDGAIANAGLHDQLAALGWVREHIGAFGGDPSNVTLFGESAGGGSIVHLLAAARSSELFHRAVVASGATDRTLQPATAALVADAFVDAAGGASALRDLSVEALLNAQATAAMRADVWEAVGMMPFHPMVDGELIGALPQDALAAGSAEAVDVIIGTTRDEMALFVDRPAIDEGQLLRRLARYASLDEQACATIADGYRRALAADGGRSDPIDVWIAAQTDREMLLPARRLLDAQASRRPTTYAYRFDWDSPPRPDGRPLGAAHAVDLPFLFGRFDRAWIELLGGEAVRERAEAVSTALRSALTSFAHGAVPLLPDGTPWPGWADGHATVRFGGRSAVAEVVGDVGEARAELWRTR